MALNLDGAQRVIENLMESEISIYHLGAKVLDPNTGLMSQARTLLYNGKAVVGSDTSPEFYRPDSGERQRVYYTIMIPKDEEVRVVPYDEIVVTSNPRQPNLEGAKLILIGPVAGTFEVAYRMRAWLDETTS